MAASGAMAGEGPLIYLIAGEPSGDALGANLMRALKEKTGGTVRFAGIGGEQMTAQGLSSLVPIGELAIMGVAEVLPRARRILRRWTETVADIRRLRPDAVVTIDSSGFNWRVAQRLRRAGETLPLIHYVAPMVWAWRPGTGAAHGALVRPPDGALALRAALFRGGGIVLLLCRPSGGGDGRGQGRRRGFPQAPRHRGRAPSCWWCCRAAGAAR